MLKYEDVNNVRGVLELQTYVGRQALRQDASTPIKYMVRIFDARNVYGRLEVLVKPLEGTGEAWVVFDTLKVVVE